MSEEKLRCEIEKLKLEIQQLRKKFFQQPSSWLSIIGVLVALGGTIGQSLLSSIRVEQAKLDVKQVQHARDSLVTDTALFAARKDALNRTNGALNRTNDSLKIEIAGLLLARGNLARQVNSFITSTPVATLSTPARRQIETAARASYSVAAYCYGISPLSCEQVRAAVRGQGYSLIRSELLQARPEWLASRSTVLFYDPRAEADAQKLALLLQPVLQHQVVVSRGQGRGVSGDSRWSLRVHVLTDPSQV